MKWTSSFIKQGGSLRVQFSSWKVPKPILDEGKLSDGDRCRISITVGSYLHSGSYVLTSGGEFRLPPPVRESLADLSKTDPSLVLEFNIFKGRIIEDASIDFDKQVAESRELTSEERRKRLDAAPKTPRRRKITVWEFARNPDVVAEVLERAGGVCEGCSSNAPFLRASDQSPYLEVHHKKRLADGGLDTVENAIALCPNCHRKSHYA